MKSLFLGLVMAISIVNFLGGEVLTVHAQEKYKVKLREELVKDKKEVEGETGVELMMNYIGMVYKFAASLIGIACVLIMVVSGIQISMGGAQDSFVSQAKDRIFQALFSLILLFGSYLVLRTVNPAFFNA